MNCVYILRYNVWIDNMYKIGCAKDLKSRLVGYKTHNAFLPETILFKEFTEENYDKIEKEYHNKFNDNLVKNTREYFFLLKHDIQILFNDDFLIYEEKYNVSSSVNDNTYMLYLKELHQIEIKEKTKQIEIK